MNNSDRSPEVEPDLTPYAGRWVALAGGQVAGVGQTAEAARRQARRNRPRERFAVRYVEEEGGRLLALSPLLERVRPILQQHPSPVYLVGGAVRDALLGQASRDLDFVVAQGAIKLAYRVGDALGMPAFVLDRARDTGRVVLAAEETTLDFASFRGQSLEDDLRARDFTINAMALPASARRDSSLIDLLGGQEALAAGLIHLSHGQALDDDPIRALRAVRLAAQLGFTLTAETAEAVKRVAPALADPAAPSAERQRDELLKSLMTPAPDQAVEQMARLGLLAVVLPEIDALATVAQSAPHHEAVLAHTARVLRWLVRLEPAVGAQGELPAAADERLQQVCQTLHPYGPDLQAHLDRPVAGGLTGRHLLRLGALWHDAGKALRQQVEEDGRIRFLRHEQAGAELADGRLRALRLSNEARSHVRAVVAGHMRPFHLSRGSQASRRAIFRYFRDCQSAGIDIALLSLADALATDDDGSEGHWAAASGSWPRLLNLVAALCHTFYRQQAEVIQPRPLLTGRQLMTALSLEPGPEVGRLLRLILEAQATGEIGTVEEAIALAKRSSHSYRR